MKKYSRILLITALSVLLVSIFAFSASAATYTIDSAADFKTYFYDSSLWGGNHTYNITIDSITLTGTQTPIGNNSTPFKGTINGDADGNGVQCTISGINVSTSTAYTGFFGAAANSTFNDLILKGSVKSTYKGTTSEANGIVGGLLGRSRGNLTVKNVDSYLTVTSNGSAVGGIVGQVCMNTSGCAIRIEASTNQGTVTGFKHVGGIVGRVGGADTTHSLKGTVTIHNCKNTAAVTATEAAVGGILGYFDYRNTADLATLNVTYCSNIGSVTGSNHVGGIMGLHLASTQKYNTALKMKVLHNRGEINSTATSSYRGAIVGCIYVPLLDAATNEPQNMFTLEDWQHVGLDTGEGLVGIIGKPGTNQAAAEITILRAYNMVGKQILRSKDTISGTVAFNSNNVTLNTCRNVNSSESAMASLDSSSDLWTTNSGTGIVTLAAYTHPSHTYTSASPCVCTFCLTGGNHKYSDYVWKYDSDAKKYHITCVCGEVYTEQIAPPVVYVGTGGSDSKDGMSRANRVLTLKEAVSRLVNTGGTVAICGQLPIDSDIYLPTWKNTITFTADNSSGNTSFNSNGYVQAGLLIKTMDVQLQLKGNAIFDDILFKANDSSNYRIIISANWYNLEMKHVRAMNNATCYIIAGTYGETASSTTLTATKNTSIKIDGPSLTDSFASSVGYFYERIVLGSSPLETVTIKNKTVTLTVQDGYKTASATERTEPALIYFLYAMSTADRIQTVYTENCTSNVYFNDNSMVHAFATGSQNVGEAGTETFVNPDGTKETITFTDGNAYLDKLNVYFNDNSNITDGLTSNKKALNKPDATSKDKIFENLGRFYVLNTKNTTIKISDEDGFDEYTGEGTRSIPLYHNLFFFRNGTFDSSSITATITADYGRHGFLPTLGNDTIFESGPATSRNTYAYTLTQSIDPECIWNDGVVTTAPTPSKAGVMTYTCTICGRTKTGPVYHEHEYVVNEDGSYYCYDFANNKVWTECTLTAPTTSVFIAATPVTHCKTVTLDVTITATEAIAASEFKVSAPAGFVLKSADVKLSATDAGTGLTATTSGGTTLPYSVMLVQNPAVDATVAKTVVVTLTFDVSAVTHNDGKAHVVKVYDAASYNTSETEIATTAVSAEVTVAHKSAVTEAVAPTCTETGLTEGQHCSVCSEVLVAQEVVPMLGHTWSDWADVDGTNHSRTCSACGEIESGTHSFTNWSSANDTQHTRTCMVCEYTQTRTHTVTVLVTAAVAPTCDKDGSTAVYKCMHCEYTQTAEVVPATGHTEVVDAAVAPTCTETGLTEGKHCSVCSEVLVAQEVVPMLGHDWDDGVVTKNPTLEEKGIVTYTCSVCGDTRTEEIEHIEVTQGFYLGVTLRSEYLLEYIVPVEAEVSDCWIIFEKSGEEPSTVYPTEVNGMWRFEVPGIAAKEMNDTVSGTYYYVKNDVLYKAATKHLNLVSYYEVMADYSAELEPVLNAMFNYGAAAQTYFGYNTENLVTEHIPTDAIVDYTITEVAVADETVIGEAVEGQLYTPASIFATLEQRISTSINFEAVDGIDTNNLVFKGRYTNVNGAELSIEVGGESMDITTKDGKTFLCVTVDTIAAKDLRQEFTGALYIGDTQVSPTVTTSFEAYAAKAIASDDIPLKAVCRAALAYSDAAAEYLRIKGEE